eukprot:COSAG02_NODE_19492_length_879_cov_1.114103_1_plen_117_part_10
MEQQESSMSPAFGLSETERHVAATLFRLKGPLHQADNAMARRDLHLAQTTPSGSNGTAENLHNGDSSVTVDTTVALDKDSTTSHVMLSYNWNHQEIVVRLASLLKEVGGYRVWIDIE